MYNENINRKHSTKKRLFKNKQAFILLLLLLTLSAVLSASFALWQLTLKQNQSNTLKSSCFKVEITDKNPISLVDAFPISDKEGAKLLPYEFTITNTCKAYASYQINLEILDDSTLKDLSTIKIMLTEDKKEKNPILLNTNNQTTITLENATTSYKLETGYLKHEESKTYNLRIWLSEDTKAETAFMNKTLNSKITVISSYISDKSNPVANFSLSSNESSILIDASSSFDDDNTIDKYYYSIDGTNFIESKSSTYEFTNLPYQMYTIYVKVSDSVGKMSEVKKVEAYPKVNAVNYVKSLSNNNEVVTDGTKDNNSRYIGKNPHNYIWFNDELWRIIGAMNNIKDDSNKPETRLKIIRSEPIGSYSWDSSNQEVNYGYGVNEWSLSSVAQLLNPGYESKKVGGSLYFNRNSGSCNNKENYSSTSCSFTNTGLKEESKQLIIDAVWNTGANGTFTIENEITTKKSYELERSSNKGKTCSKGDVCNDEITRTTTWLGKIGLMYPSDYGYATSGGSTASRATCINALLYDWSNSEYGDCRENNWLYKPGTFQWTMTPYSTTDIAVYATFIYDTGKVDAYDSCDARSISPTLFLKSDLFIVRGSGSISDPFVIE